MNKLTPISSTQVYHRLKDYSVTGEKFDLLYDEERDMLVTNPRPKPEEISRYYKSEEYISHTDSKKTFFEKIYHYVKSYMLQKKLSWINKKFPSRGKLLDIGAGTGDFLIEAKKFGWKVSGIEPDENARKKAGDKGIKLFPNAERFKANKYDVITLWHVLEHIHDLKAQIIEFEHLLKKNGLLVIAVPNFKSYDAKYYKEHWAAYDVPRHLWHFSQKSFKHLMAGTSFKQSDSKPLIFDAYYVSMLSEKYRTGRFNFLNAFFIGLKSNSKAKSSSEYSSIAYFFRKTN